MNTQLLYLAAAPFEAAARVAMLPSGHRSHGLHGHGYLASVRAASTDGAEGLAARLTAAVAPLDYSYLNDTLEMPTDENVARWIRARLADEGIESVGIQSTREQGVDLDRANRAHLWRRFRFEAAHQLPGVRAGHPCGRMHGHGFEVILHLGEELARRDMGVDYDRLDALWQPLHGELHRHCLNDIEGLHNPTSEMLARWIWQRLQPRLPELSWVTVYETVTAGCHYDGANFRIWKEQRFESAVRDSTHRLLGHSYVARLHLSAPLDPLLGWTIDYGDVREAFTPVFRELDHQLLNDTTATGGELALLLQWLRERCAVTLPALDRIDLYETPLAGATLCWGAQGPALPGRMP